MKTKALLLFTCAATTLFAGANSFAQVLTDELVVTAQKKEENAQSVGISITAFSGDQIEKLGFQTTTDVVAQTPGLQVYEFSPTLTIFNIRGVSQNSFTDNLEGPIAVYIDDAYVGSLGAHNQPLYDIERIEVLKGPQGTLYGRNATGGLIHYISRKPTDEFEFRAAATYGSYNYHNVEAAVGGPISDFLRARIAVSDIQEDGYLKSQNPSVRDAYGKNSTAVKAFVEADLGANATLLINPYWIKDSDVPTGAYSRRAAVQDPVTGRALDTPFDDDVFTHHSEVQGYLDREIYGITGKLDWKLSDGVSLTSITNYYEMQKSYLEDGDGRNLTIGDIFGSPPFGPGTESFASLGMFNWGTSQDYNQFSQEVRLSGETGKLSWQTGVYYLDLHHDNSSNVEGFAAVWFNPATGDLTQRAVNEYTMDATSVSVFAQSDFAVTDRFKIVAGLRWVHDDKSIDSITYYEEADSTVLARGADGEVQSVYGPGFDGDLIAPFCYGVAVDARCAGDVAEPAANFKYNDWAGKIQVNYLLGDSTLVYAGVNRGTKGGNWVALAFPDSIVLKGADSLSHREETLVSYEGGVKSTILGGRGRFNAAVFYYDYNDYQAFSVLNYTPTITNNDASVLGGEFELAVNPVDGLDLLLGGVFLDTDVDDIVTPSGVVIDTKLPNAPKISLNGLARYAWPMFGGEGSIQFDANYNSEQYLEVANSPSSRQGGYVVSNMRVAFAPKDNVDIAFWIKNLNNAEYRIYTIDNAGAPTPFVLDTFAKPRTFGGTVSVRF